MIAEIAGIPGETVAGITGERTGVAMIGPTITPVARITNLTIDSTTARACRDLGVQMEILARPGNPGLQSRECLNPVDPGHLSGSHYSYFSNQSGCVEFCFLLGKKLFFTRRFF